MKEEILSILKDLVDYADSGKVAEPSMIHRANRIIVNLEREQLNTSTPDWVFRIQHEINNQDNGITADPIFIVFEKRETVVDEDYGFDRIVWLDDKRGESEEVDERTRARLEALHNGWRDIGERWRRVAVKEIDEFVTACFTRAGCEEYLERNGHNLRKPYIYVHSLFRNKEMKQIREWLAAGAPRSVDEAAASVGLNRLPEAPALVLDDETINGHLDSVLRASGSALRNYSMELTKRAMREAMLKAMTDGAIAADVKKLNVESGDFVCFRLNTSRLSGEDLRIIRDAFEGVMPKGVHGIVLSEEIYASVAKADGLMPRLIRQSEEMMATLNDVLEAGVAQVEEEFPKGSSGYRDGMKYWGYLRNKISRFDFSNPLLGRSPPASGENKVDNHEG